MRRFLVTFSLLMPLIIPSLWAQADWEYNAESTSGIVNKISKSQLTLKEYDYEVEKEVDVTYDIDPKVELVGMKTLTDLAPGDEVEIQYLEEENKGQKPRKLIKSIEKIQELEDTGAKPPGAPATPTDESKSNRNNDSLDDPY